MDEPRNEPRQKPRKGLQPGTQTFERIIGDSALYVDKTRYIADLVAGPGRFWFLSRPRRFGKSMTVSTLEALFAGRRDLFEGLAIEGRLDEPRFAPRPVVRLDISRFDTSKGAEGFARTFDLKTAELSESLGFPCPPNVTASDVVGRLVEKLSAKSGGGVAVLIDEYDAPAVEFLDKPGELEGVREATRHLYKRLKAVDRHISFLFATGVRKAASPGLFSAFNNINDISRLPGYGAMLGFTHEELEADFGPHIDETASELGMGRVELLAKLEDLYDGFCFDGLTRVYNPFAIPLFFMNKRFLNYWFDTGSSERVARYLGDRHLTVERFRGLPVSDDFLRRPADPAPNRPALFLLQTGNLVARSAGPEGGHVLDYPNREARGAMARLEVENYFGEDDYIEAGLARDSLRRALAKADPGGVVEAFNEVSARIPYGDFGQAARRRILRRFRGVEFGDWLFRSTLLSFLVGARVRAEAELACRRDRGRRDRPDLVAFHKGRLWVVEFKIVPKGGDAEEAAQTALNRIVETGWAEGRGGGRSFWGWPWKWTRAGGAWPPGGPGSLRGLGPSRGPPWRASMRAAGRRLRTRPLERDLRAQRITDCNPPSYVIAFEYGGQR